MIQDIAPHKLRNEYDPNAVPGGNDFVMIIDGGQIFAKNEEELLFPRVSELIHICGKNLQYLFSVDDERYFLYTGFMTADNPGNPETDDVYGSETCPYCHLTSYHFINIKELRAVGTNPKYRVFAANTGKHLADWYRDNKFCGRCGIKMVHSKTERAKVCPDCHYTAYPRIMPAVIVGVLNQDKILVTRYRTGFAHNALIAGFTEIGETMEETVAREVMEEAGLRVKNIRYYKSQPWGIANDILAGYYCEVDGDDTIHMDGNELKYAEWTTREELVLQPDEASLTNEMMKNFKTGKIDLQFSGNCVKVREN